MPTVPFELRDDGDSARELDDSKFDISQDHSRDSDARILDSLVESEAEPPSPKELPTETRIVEHVPPKPLSRLMSGTTMLDALWNAPTMIAPADRNRESILIAAAAVTGVAFVAIADDPGKLMSVYNAGAAGVTVPGAFIMIPAAGASYTITKHTGPLYAIAVNSTGVAGITAVSYFAVTS